MMGIQKYTNYIWASAAKHFKDILAQSNIQLFFEESDLTNVDLPFYAKFRLDGPHHTLVSKNNWKFNIDINILYAHKIDANTQVERLNKGAIVAAFRNINVYAYGDTNQYLGCLNLVPMSQNTDIFVHNFGRASEDQRLLQAIIEGTFEMRLTIQGE